MHRSMRQSHVCFALVTNVYLSLRTFLPTFCYFQSFHHCISRFVFAYLITKSREKQSFPLTYCTSALLCFDNMENLEDTFRSLSRFVQGRCYAVLITVYNNVDRILLIYVYEKLQQINAITYLRNYSWKFHVTCGKHFA